MEYTATRLNAQQIIVKPARGTSNTDPVTDPERDMLDEWEDEYIDRTLTDGDLWNFVITYQNGKEKKYIGRSSYPYNFDAFLDLNREIINEVYYV